MNTVEIREFDELNYTVCEYLLRNRLHDVHITCHSQEIIEDLSIYMTKIGIPWNTDSNLPGISLSKDSGLAKEISALQQYTICVTNSPGVFYSCKKLLLETRYLKFAIGFHPQEKTLSDRALLDFMRLVDYSNYVGEIGIDLSNKSYRDEQSQVYAFEQVVKKCAANNKLMTVHIKHAEEHALRIIKKYYPTKCIIHWFTGSEKQIAVLFRCWMLFFHKYKHDCWEEWSKILINPCRQTFSRKRWSVYPCLWKALFSITAKRCIFTNCAVL